MKLVALPNAFDLKELKKGWFPNFFNTRDNQHYIRPYPDPSYYGCDFMGSEEREECLSWLESKIDIIRQACLKFRHLLMSATGAEVTDDKGATKRVVAIDPFDSVTIASVCMNVYRTKFLEEEWRVKLSGKSDWTRAKYWDGHLNVLMGDQWVPANEFSLAEKEFVSSAKIPPGGYKSDQYSKSSIQWLEWRGCSYTTCSEWWRKVSFGNQVQIRWFLSREKYRLRISWLRVPQMSPMFLYGQRRDETPPHTTIDERTLCPDTEKESLPRMTGYEVVCIWEHEFREICQTNPELRQFLQSLDVTDRLDQRDSGRINASQLYYKAKETEQIKYVDFTSLYPFMNKTCEYPVGHPEVITSDFQDLDQYFGIAKVRILPPRGLYYPV